MPDIQLNNIVTEDSRHEGADEDLGFYKDGVRRTLTDEQIAMFRHSEIQRLLAERRRQRDREEERQQKLERKKTGSTQQVQDRQQSVTFESDERVHARPGMPELSYDDAGAHQHTQKPTTFQWPKLGP